MRLDGQEGTSAPAGALRNGGRHFSGSRSERLAKTLQELSSQAPNCGTQPEKIQCIFSPERGFVSNICQCPCRKWPTLRDYRSAVNTPHRHRASKLCQGASLQSLLGSWRAGLRDSQGSLPVVSFLCVLGNSILKSCRAFHDTGSRGLSI